VLVVFTVALVLASVLVGLFTAVSVQSRAQALDDLAARSGPLSIAAQDLYRSLSDADATANSAFLSGGLERADVRARYEADIAQAETALATAVAAREPADVADPNSALAVLSRELSVYTGLVETARANNRQGLPVGAAYQREASTLMRDQLLPAAKQLYTDETAGLVDDQDSAAGLPIVEILLGAVLIVLLLFAQRYLRRRTRRRLNVGLLVATGAAVVSLAWVLIATIGVLANVNASEENGSKQTDVLARARIAALAARGDETLTLVARGSGQAFEEDYTKVVGELTGERGLLGTAQALATDDDVRDQVAAAMQAQQTWHDVHTKIRTADDGGDYLTAVGLAIDQDDDGAAKQFDAVDNSLREAIASTKATFEDEVGQASNALTGTVIGVILLALIAAAGAVTGIWQRLKEYR
jgi:cell division protein FtsB